MLVCLHYQRKQRRNKMNEERLIEATDEELENAPPADPEIEGSEGFGGEEV
jgi:hypothetical protein